MPRPRIGVTLTNMNKVELYFARAFKHDRLRGRGWFNNHDIFFEAKENFQKLPSIDSKTPQTKKHSTQHRCDALQKWIDAYIPSEKWQRCLLTLRQDKSRRKLKLRQLNLQSDVYLIVKALAKKKEMTMGELIRTLAEPVLNKMYKQEFNKELTIKSKK
jgi:hypothetical protein